MASPISARGVDGLSPADIRDHYDDFAGIYRLYWGEHIHHGLFRAGDETPQQAQELLLSYCADLARIRRGMEVADVGCGEGGSSRFLARKYGCRVMGVTISEIQFQAAVNGTQPLPDPAAVHYALADAESYAFPVARFDVVWNMESCEHFFDKPGYFRKAAAALKPGGRLMLATWTGSMRQALVREIARVFLCPELLTADEYRAQIQSAGLRVLHGEELGPWVARTWDICADHARLAESMLALLPEKFRGFARGIELMREGFRNGKLNYSVFVAEK